MVQNRKAGRLDAAASSGQLVVAVAPSAIDPIRRRSLSAGFFTGLMLLMLAALLSACSPIYRNHGYVPAETELALLVVGTDTRNTVAEKVGRPTALGLLNDVGWYYVQSRYKLSGPREPQEIDRQVVAISFDDGGIVRNIERFGLQDGRVVALSRRVTETSIQEIGLIRQLLRNVGRIAPSTLLGQ